VEERLLGVAVRAFVARFLANHVVAIFKKTSCSLTGILKNIKSLTPITAFNSDMVICLARSTADKT
jgi:hypothetical protein